MTTKAQRVKEYNENNKGYYITNIKKMTQEQVDNWKKYSENTLHELYKRPSDAKVNSWRKLWVQYEPLEVLGFTGNSQTYSVMLVAANGDLLHITRDNNYLVEVQ